MKDDWTRWQGHLINGVFPLGRYIGCSDHSGVFLTRSASGSAPELAIKLVPADRAVAEALLPRWKRAGGLTHPHLLRLYEWGGCQLEGFPYLYVVMEYADQTLAQLLQSRALTELEAREMLAPVLDALAFLHGRNLVQGQLKPANFLVVGDQLKLASDTIRRCGEMGPSAHTKTLYDPPEGLHGASSPAGDIRALGITLCEALTRRPPSVDGEHGEASALPADIAPSFREIVARCANRRPQDRPALPELLAWAGGHPESSTPAPSVHAPTVEPALPTRVEAKPPEPKAPEIPPADPAPVQPVPAVVSADPVRPVPEDARPETPRPPITLLLGIVAALVLVWGGWHLIARRASPAVPAHTAPSASLAAPQIAGAVSSTSAEGTKGFARSATITRASVATAKPQALREIVPDVPLGARRTVRGHIKVWVRAIVDQDGSVLATVIDRSGPSKYFQRLALQAAKQWTFSPAGDSAHRLMQIRFDFSRDGTQARAVPLD